MATYGSLYAAGLTVCVLCCALLVQEVAAFYVGDKHSQISQEALDQFDLDNNNLGEAPLGIPSDKRSDSQPEYFTEQKRYLCRKFFIYNPVRGRCMPTLLALRKGRKTRSATADDN